MPNVSAAILERIAKADQFRKEGLSFTKALNQAKIARGTYLKHTRGTKGAPKYIDLAPATERKKAKALIIVTDVENLSEAIKELFL